MLGFFAICFFFVQNVEKTLSVKKDLTSCWQSFPQACIQKQEKEP